jgi:hypothetical protein
MSAMLQQKNQYHVSFAFSPAYILFIPWNVCPFSHKPVNLPNESAKY